VVSELRVPPEGGSLSERESPGIEFGRTRAEGGGTRKEAGTEGEQTARKKKKKFFAKRKDKGKGSIKRWEKIRKKGAMVDNQGKKKRVVFGGGVSEGERSNCKKELRPGEDFYIRCRERSHGGGKIKERIIGKKDRRGEDRDERV